MGMDCSVKAAPGLRQFEQLQWEEMPVYSGVSWCKYLVEVCLKMGGWLNKKPLSEY